MEQHESTMEGAAREAFEEANARIAIEALLAVYSIPRLSQVQLIYRAHLATPGIAAGPESEEVGFFAFDEIPWKDLAFPSVHWALGHDREVGDRKDFAPFVNPPGEFGDLKQAGL
jgi:8-oxo-dGTP pyrophosphatase MutT (NUDIX family)